MTRILAGIDPSPGAADALRAALDVASATDGRVSLLRVIEGSGGVAGSREALVSAALLQLRELATQVPATRLGNLLASAGEVWWELCHMAQSVDADLVVVGAHRYGRFDRVLGTTAAQVVNRCDRSVLVVRDWRQALRRILVALDDSAHATTVRQYAVALARHTGGRLRLFHAFDMPPVVPADMLRQFPTMEVALRDAADKALGPHEELVPPELRDGVGARQGATAWREICAAAKDYDADLVVVGSRGYSFTERLLGTTAGEVVDHIDRSALVVRQPWRE